MLDTVAPGGNGCPKNGLVAKNKLIPSSYLNSIRLRFVKRKTEDKRTIITNKNRFERRIFLSIALINTVVQIIHVLSYNIFKQKFL